MTCCQYMLLLATLPVCSAALAQSGTATWQVSADGGVTWTSDAVLTGSQAVKVRLRMGWAGVANSIAYGGSQLDAFILNTAADDSVSDISRPRPFNFAAQTIVATAYASGTKIDVSSDTALPGAGAGWVNPGQGSPDSLGDPPNTSNPAAVFTYTLYIGSTTGTRTISHIFNPVTGRALSVYTSQAGAQFRFSANQVTINTATITVIPSPSVASLIPFAGVLACRRRR